MLYLLGMRGQIPIVEKAISFLERGNREGAFPIKSEGGVIIS